jgi:hypothetical protein
MKRHVPAITTCVICISILSSCRTQPSLPSHQDSGQLHNLPAADDPNSSPAAQDAPDSARYEFILSNLIVLEGAIYNDPHDAKKIMPLLKASFDSSSGCFLVVGKGTHNKSFPESSWKQGRKIASSYDAKRWALYCKVWSQGNQIAFGARISGEITYSKILLERLDGDTLFTLVSVPLGSIVDR